MRSRRCGSSGSTFARALDVELLGFAGCLPNFLLHQNPDNFDNMSALARPVLRGHMRAFVTTRASKIVAATAMSAMSRRLTTTSFRAAPVVSSTTYFASMKEPLPANTVIRFVPQQTAWIVERMGKFHKILQPGLAILIPFLDRIAYVKSLKEVALEIPSQKAITADNVTLELDGVLYTRVFDAYKARFVARTKTCDDYLSRDRESANLS